MQPKSVIQPRVVTIKPLSDIKRQLKVDPPVEVLRVTSDRASYWRLTGLGSYDGREWVLEARPRELREGVVPAAKPPVHGDVLRQTYRLTSLLAPWLPAAYAAESIESDAPIQVDEGSQTLFLRDDARPGLTYTVFSRLTKVSSNPEVRLPPSDDPRAAVFAQQARSIVGNARTPSIWLDRTASRRTYCSTNMSGSGTTDTTPSSRPSAWSAADTSTWRSAPSRRSASGSRLGTNAR